VSFSFDSFSVPKILPLINSSTPTFVQMNVITLRKPRIVISPNRDSMMGSMSAEARSKTDSFVFSKKIVTTMRKSIMQ